MKPGSPYSISIPMPIIDMPILKRKTPDLARKVPVNSVVRRKHESDNIPMKTAIVELRKTGAKRGSSRKNLQQVPSVDDAARCVIITREGLETPVIFESWIYSGPEEKLSPFKRSKTKI